MGSKTNPGKRAGNDATSLEGSIRGVWRGCKKGDGRTNESSTAASLALRGRGWRLVSDPWKEGRSRSCHSTGRLLPLHRGQVKNGSLEGRPARVFETGWTKRFIDRGVRGGRRTAQVGRD